MFEFTIKKKKKGKNKLTFYDTTTYIQHFSSQEYLKYFRSQRSAAICRLGHNLCLTNSIWGLNMDSSNFSNL